jgi:O-antigen ligase
LGAATTQSNPAAERPSDMLWLAALGLIAASFTRWHYGPFHPADAILIFAAVIVAIRRPTVLPPLPPFALPLLLISGLAVISSPALPPALSSVAKDFAIVFVAAVVLAQVSIRSSSAIALCIAAATAGTVLVAAVQYLGRGDAVSISGLLDNRTLYGCCVAAGAPFVLMIVNNDKQLSLNSAVMVLILSFAFVFIAALTILSAPMLALFGLAALAAASQRKAQMIAVSAALLLAMALIGTHHLPRDNKAALLGSVSAFDDAGHPRRCATEVYAAAHAIADRPLLGHGPASYQSVVSSAQYRGALPPPAENRVEPGTNPGYLVAAVEIGLPGALLLAAMLIACGIRGMAISAMSKAEPDPVALAAAISVFTLAAGTMFTVTLINGPGFLLAAVMGLCLAPKETTLMAETAMPRGPRSFIYKAGAVAAALLIGVLLHTKRAPLESYDDIAAADLSGAGRSVVVLEAEDCSTLVAPMRRNQRGDASSGSCVGVDEFAGKPPAVEGSATYSVNITQHGRYRIWLRAWWSDGCANSIAASLDNQPAYLLGNDGNYHNWHWVRGPVTELRAGAHLLTLLEREDNMEIDEIALSNDDAFVPNGALAATQRISDSGLRIADSKPTTTPVPTPTHTPEKSPDPEPFIVEPKSPPSVTQVPAPAVAPTITEKQPDPAPAQSAIRNPPGFGATESPPNSTIDPPSPKIDVPKIDPPSGKPLLVGIGGAYRDGFEDHLVSMGVPYVRLRDDELESIEALKNIDVMMVSVGESSCNPSAFFRTIYAFLKSGRTAVVEFLPVGSAAGDDPEDLFLLKSHVQGFGNATLLSDDSKFFKDVPRSVTYPGDVTCNWLPASTNVAGATIYGGLSAYGSGRKTNGALMVRKVGDGKLYYLGLSAAFSAMWRGRKVDPFLANVIRDAVGEKCCFPFADLKYAPHETAKVKFSDDFMRQPGSSGGWKVLDGKFGLTGESGDQLTAFSTHGVETSFAAIGNENWKDYRAAASVLLKDGEAGLWQTTAAGGRLTLRLRDHGKSVALVLRVALDSNQSAPAQEKILAEADVSEYPNSWRRLALLRRNGQTEGFVDGERVIAVKTAPEALGKCGLCVIKGDAFFDDFAAIDTAAVTPGRDVAPGEESSERCMVRYYQRCSEKMSVYSPQWMLKPHPIDQHYLQLALPLYKGGALQIDDRAPIPLAAGDDLGLLKLPAGVMPSFDLALHTNGWRDYHFAGRVTDWYQTSGEWSQINRWSCNPEYEWYGGRASSDAVLWTKRSMKGNAAMEALMAPCANQTYHEEQGHDLNLVLYGNGRDLSEGYLFTVLSAGRGCQISKNGKVLASAPAPGPAASGHSLHHTWFSVIGIVSGKKIQMYFDRRLACECTDEQPLSQGKFGIWTRKNKISVARATLSDGDGE